MNNKSTKSAADLWLGEHWDDWYSLEGVGNWVSVEGTGAEWLSIADTMERRERIGFRRVAVCAFGGPAQFWSPRNSIPRDLNGILCEVAVPEDQIDALAAKIRQTVVSRTFRDWQ